MKFKPVFRKDDYGTVSLWRVMWNRGQVGDGNGYSAKFSMALAPRIFQFRKEFLGWILTIAGVRFQYERSYGGIFS